MVYRGENQVQLFFIDAGETNGICDVYMQSVIFPGYPFERYSK